MTAAGEDDGVAVFEALHRRRTRSRTHSSCWSLMAKTFDHCSPASAGLFMTWRLSSKAHATFI
jgi:hypothetical protein